MIPTYPPPPRPPHMGKRVRARHAGRGSHVDQLVDPVERRVDGPAEAVPVPHDPPALACVALLEALPGPVPTGQGEVRQQVQDQLLQ